MNQAFKIGTLFGSDLRLHWSWPIVLAGVVAYSLAIFAWREATIHVLVLLSIYLFVLIHEGAQYLAARHYGLGTRDATLYPFWGVARLGQMSERPWQEIYIAATGPVVLALLAATIGGAMSLANFDITFPDQQVHVTVHGFATRLFWASVLLTALHVLPILPLDGGRILRAILTMRKSRLRATEISALVTTVAAGLLLAAAIFWLRSPLLGATAFLLFLGAQEDLGTTRYFDRLRHPADHRRPSALVALTEVVTPDCQPDEPNFTGFTWNARARLWIEWRDGRPVSANALIGDGPP